MACPQTCLNRMAEHCVIHRPELEDVEDAEQLVEHLEAPEIGTVRSKGKA